jgi:hypothetical protein
MIYLLRIQCPMNIMVEEETARHTVPWIWQACRARGSWTRTPAGIVVCLVLALSTGVVLCCHSLLQMNHTARTTRTDENIYLLQVWCSTSEVSSELTNNAKIYAGYFLVMLLILMHCLACGAWQGSRIQHVAIFEYDAAQAAEWRRLAEVCLPSSQKASDLNCGSAPAVAYSFSV